MNRRPARSALRLGSFVPFALAAASACAAPPEIKGLSPLGVQRGVAAELTVNGSALSGNPKLIAPFRFKVEEAVLKGSDAGNFKTRIIVDPTTPVGVHVVRVQTDEGLSNPFLMSIGQLPQVAEKEDNNALETAQPVDAPVVIEGQAAGNDVDYYRFKGKKGQRVVVDAQCSRIGSGVDPSIRLTAGDRTFIASADDSAGLITDARLFAVLPADGDYVVEISDSRYQGGGRPVYRLVVGEVPAAEEIYPLGGRNGETTGFELRGGNLNGVEVVAATLHSALGSTVDAVRAACSSNAERKDIESLPPLAVSELPEIREPADPSAPVPHAAVPSVLNGRIDPAGDEDRFVVAVVPGQRVRVEVKAADIGSALDGVLQVLNPSGGVISTADDTTTQPPKPNPRNLPATISPDPSVEFLVPSGVTEVTLALRDLERRGGVGFPYRITVSPVSVGFTLTLNDAQLAIPKGGTAAVPVTVERKGYNGPITLNVLNPPAGITVRPGTIADGQLLGTFTVSAAADASLNVASLDVVGEGKGSAGPIVEHAGKTTVFAQQGPIATNSVHQVGLVTALSTAAPLSLDAPAGPVEVAHGFGTTVKLTANRPKGAEGALAFSPAPLPPGLAVPGAKLDEKAGEVQVAVNTTTDHPLGKVSVVLSGKGKVAGADRTLTAPAVTLDVVRPATVELASASIELKAGGTGEVKGKVVRKGGFKEAVTVKLGGLPAGVKADSVNVAADASEFTLKLSAEAKAAAATAGATVTPAFQVNKKDYPSPTAPLSVKVVAAK